MLGRDLWVKTRLLREFIMICLSTTLLYFLQERLISELMLNVLLFWWFEPENVLKMFLTPMVGYFNKSIYVYVRVYVVFCIFQKQFFLWRSHVVLEENQTDTSQATEQTGIKTMYICQITRCAYHAPHLYAVSRTLRTSPSKYFGDFFGEHRFDQAPLTERQVDLYIILA